MKQHSNKDKCFLCFAAPSDPPQNVSYTLLTTTAVRLSWSPPNQPNGIIQYYTIHHTDNTNNNTKYTQVYTLTQMSVDLLMCSIFYLNIF